MSVRLEPGDCREVIRTIPDVSIDACCTDPPYSLTANKPGGSGAASLNERSPAGRSRIGTGGGFMGQTWDTGEVAHDPEWWREVYRVLKPGAHLVAFGGTRTHHRMVCAIEDAGFEIRDTIGFLWAYGTGLPKSHNIAKAINVYVASNPDAQKWEGWGTALKPSFEPIVLARKPLSERTVAANVLRWGTGALNIDGCRIGVEDSNYARNCAGDRGHDQNRQRQSGFAQTAGSASAVGRWPANLCHDGSDEVLAAFPESGAAYVDAESAARKLAERKPTQKRGITSFDDGKPCSSLYTDKGSAARFFFSAKAGKEDRLGSKHPTVKPVELIRWLMRLVTPPKGTVLDPFAGSGTAGVAALAEGFNAILIEREIEYLADIRERLAFHEGEGRHSMVSKARRTTTPRGDTPLFDREASTP